MHTPHAAALAAARLAEGRCGHMSHHGRCILSPGHDASIPHQYPVTATPAPADPWPIITRLTSWLDDRNGRSGAETALRILKVTEEAGEVAQAWIGMTGQNPRKGVTHTAADVADELCDVITAAMVALATITTDPGAHFDRKVQQIAALRLDATGGEQ